MPDKTIGSLPSIADLYDDTLIPVEQQGEASKMTGRQFRGYAVASVSEYAEAAAKSAEAAAGSAADAGASAKIVSDYKDAIQAIKDNLALIQAAPQYAANAKQSETAAAGSAKTAKDAETQVLETAKAFSELLDLLKHYEITDILLDSDDDAILDSDGNIILSTLKGFEALLWTVKDLQRQITTNDREVREQMREDKDELQRQITANAEGIEWCIEKLKELSVLHEQVTANAENITLALEKIERMKSSFGEYPVDHGILDSDGAPLLDSDGEPILGRIIFLTK